MILLSICATDSCPLEFDTIRLRLPWPPSVNHSHTITRHRTKAYNAFRSACWGAIYEQRIPRRFLSHPMALTIYQRARNGRSDIDNAVKCVIDVIKTAGVIYDDNRDIVRRLTIIDGPRTKDPHVMVEIECLSDR